MSPTLLEFTIALYVGLAVFIAFRLRGMAVRSGEATARNLVERQPLAVDRDMRIWSIAQDIFYALPILACLAAFMEGEVAIALVAAACVIAVPWYFHKKFLKIQDAACEAALERLAPNLGRSEGGAKAIAGTGSAEPELPRS